MACDPSAVQPYHGPGHAHETGGQRLLSDAGYVDVSIFEQVMPARFRLAFSDPAATLDQATLSLETI
jgi:hypothetical protein